MNNSSYHIRNYQPSDFAECVRLSAEAEKIEPGRRPVLSPDFATRLHRPGCCPERDCFVAEKAGQVVACMEVVPELTIGRVILDCWVKPEHRHQGLAKGFLHHAVRRAKELGVSRLHLNIAENNAVAQRILSRLGFTCVRRFLELSVDMDEIEELAVPGCRRLQHGEEEKLARIQNRSFADTWGYNLNTAEKIGYYVHLGNGVPEDVILYYDDNQVASYCWTRVAVEAGVERGRIFMIGVDPDYRNRGIGKKILLAGLAHLKSKGVRVAELTVDSENETALTLYRAVGFEVTASSLWYEKVIGQDTGAK
ncbi:GNAT family N-acetyltransferase [Chloroflexota bacterium]